MIKQLLIIPDEGTNMDAAHKAILAADGIDKSAVNYGCGRLLLVEGEEPTLKAFAVLRDLEGFKASVIIDIINE